MSYVSRSRRLGLFTLVRTVAGCGVIALSACSSSSGGSTGTGGTGGAGTAHDPATATVASVDRFSAQAGHLQVRSSSNGLPAANAAVDFDQGPFITQGFGPTGQVVKYYNFDVQPATPAPTYAFFVAGATSPVAGQLNVIDVLPGDAGYNDFWQVMMVTVPSSYVANTIASLSEIQTAGYTITPTNMLVNCPVVPAGEQQRLPLILGKPIERRQRARGRGGVGAAGLVVARLEGEAGEIGGRLGVERPILGQLHGLRFRLRNSSRQVRWAMV